MPSIVQPDHAEAGGLGDAGEGAVDVPRLDLTAGTGGEDIAGLLPLLPALIRAAACRIRCQRRGAMQRAGSGTARRRRLFGSSS